VKKYEHGGGRRRAVRGTYAAPAEGVGTCIHGRAKILKKEKGTQR
jgi:hypothetical protein